ncbi:polysaccharide deacetylase [Calothrix sp. NIES-4071]|nr:polysaccharide deacetylase [Calothrix sp. NIES-4071]BAZ54653.1 polysaccharide deacetylase [Calothrix sp. NIES-4105]
MKTRIKKVKTKKSFFLRRLLLISIIISTSVLTYTLLTRQNQQEAFGKGDSSNQVPANTLSSTVFNETHHSQALVPESKISFHAPSNFAGTVVHDVKLNTTEKYVALTFDDGPWHNSTEQVLKILRQNHIKATFFMIGQNVKAYPQQAKNVLAEGHAIGNHTWHHWYMHMNPQLAASEIESTADIIYQTTGAKTTLFRPPGGILNNGLVEYAKNQNHSTILWSADSEDYRIPSVSTLIKRATKVAPGGIVLMHDGGGNRSHTVTALPQIISKLRQQGYKFVTVPELLEMQNKEQPPITVKN